MTINGAGFNSNSTVMFHGTTATNVTQVSGSQLKAVVPSGATTGPITVTNTTGTLGTVRSRANFTVS